MGYDVGACTQYEKHIETYYKPKFEEQYLLEDEEWGILMHFQWEHMNPRKLFFLEWNSPTDYYQDYQLINIQRYFFQENEKLMSLLHQEEGKVFRWMEQKIQEGYGLAHAHHTLYAFKELEAFEHPIWVEKKGSCIDTKYPNGEIPDALFHIRDHFNVDLTSYLINDEHFWFNPHVDEVESLLKQNFAYGIEQLNTIKHMISPDTTVQYCGNLKLFDVIEEILRIWELGGIISYNR